LKELWLQNNQIQNKEQIKEKLQSFLKIALFLFKKTIADKNSIFFTVLVEMFMIVV
jgi:hypothetical protein